HDVAVQFFDKTVEEDPLLDKGWIAITKFYIKKKNYQRALYFINRAINIDQDNVLYWKLYARINQKLNFLEEAERGYKRTLELGNYELDTWLCRADILIELGEYEASIFNLQQAAEFYPDCAEIEYRLGGLFVSMQESSKGRFHLKNAVKLDPQYEFIITELFPNIAEKPLVKNIIHDPKKTSN
ncbi:MAG: hypothetical protein HKN99_09175, partial [Winogradskyella sp.]|nr:hypothetical protein [Winogradskyella sp.]